MVDKTSAEQYKGKWIGLERIVNGKTIFYKGKVRKVSRKDLILEFRGSPQTYTLESITNIRELRVDEQH